MSSCSLTARPTSITKDLPDCIDWHSALKDAVRQDPT